ncbi:MAG: hypothetical protein DWI51_02340 [Chloroflexi bacterium]|nr:MAG: hypothetical protein DWI45_01900 [Chloroflexota bacterium]RLT29250.1 MAG: hypothetical protein DWI51_02340 [Chloroflexota bacterium]
MTRRSLSGAVALLLALTTGLAGWSGLIPATPVARAAEANILGSDGRYTILFLGSDKRCRAMGSPLGAERCASLEEQATAATTDAERNRYVWSRAADAAVGVSSNKAGTERTDVMSLLTVNPATGEASALSIPRDMEYFPLKPSLASTFCRPGRKTFNAKVNALFVYAQLCMSKTPTLDGWERSSLAAAKVKEELAWALDIEIDDWVLVGFGTADIMGAKLDALAPGPTVVRLNDKSRFASCRENTLRPWKGSSARYLDGNMASNARYGDLLFLRPGALDRRTIRSGGKYVSISAWQYANCAEPSAEGSASSDGATSTTPRTTSPHYITASCAESGSTATGCAFDVPSDLWVGFGRARKYDGDTSRIRRHQRLLAGITLRVINAGETIATQLAALSSLRWYSWPRRNAAGTIVRWDASAPLVRGSITAEKVAPIFRAVATAKARLEIGPDAPGGWRSFLLLGQSVTFDGRTCRVAGASRFSSGDLTPRLACTRAWISTGFGPVELAP